MTELSDKTIAIVGLGLMGGSLALALKKKNACKQILGITRSAETRKRALADGVLDEASADLGLAANADVIVLSTPVRTVIKQIAQVGAIARKNAILMDMGSTKREIVQAMEKLPTALQPIGAHPMCGKETFGYDASDENLYRNAVFVLTPLLRTSPQTISLATSLAKMLEARPVILDAERHDKIVAAISHLPFTLATTLVLATENKASQDDLLYALAAGGFRDASRLAASDTAMMLDILLTNSENIADAMRVYSKNFSELADLIASKKEDLLIPILQRAAEKRRGLFKQ